MAAEKSADKADEGKPIKLPCGCTYQDNGWMLTRVNECEYHKHKKTAKHPFRPKAECVRP